MRRIILCVLMFSTSAFAQADKARIDTFKREAPALQAAVEEVVNSVVPGLGVLQHAKATFLDGYGVVVSLEAALAPTRNPFSSPQSPGAVRELVDKRRTLIREKMEALVKQQTSKLESVHPTESLAVVVHFFNSNPADLPNLPSQLVLTAKKVDATQIAAFTVREF